MLVGYGKKSLRFASPADSDRVKKSWLGKQIVYLAPLLPLPTVLTMAIGTSKNMNVNAFLHLGGGGA